MLSEAVQARFPSATEALQSRSKEITEVILIYCNY